MPRAMLMDNCCVAFPGREAVEKGLDDSFYMESKIVKDIFEIANTQFKMNFFRLCYRTFSIPEEWKTICLMIHCYSIYSYLQAHYGTPMAFAGYSQGEFTACAAAHVFKFTEILQLVYQLEILLKEEKTQKECMYRIIDITAEQLEAICRVVDVTYHDVCVSAYISDMQNIISGKKNAVKEVILLAKKRGARWAIELTADRAYHSPLCKKVAEKARMLFAQTPCMNTNIAVFSCRTGTAEKQGSKIREYLSQQIYHPLRWKNIVDNLSCEHIQNLVEIGPGCTVSANTRLADKNINCRWIGSMSDL